MIKPFLVIKAELYNRILAHVAQHPSRRALSLKLGKRDRYISQVLAGDNPMSMRKALKLIECMSDTDKEGQTNNAIT